jgi:hypothetical protein
MVMQAATPVKWFVLDVEAMVDIDTTGPAVPDQPTCDRGISHGDGASNDGIRQDKVTQLFIIATGSIS